MYLNFPFDLLAALGWGGGSAMFRMHCADFTTFTAAHLEILYKLLFCSFQLQAYKTAQHWHWHYHSNNTHIVLYVLQ